MTEVIDKNWTHLKKSYFTVLKSTSFEGHGYKKSHLTNLIKLFSNLQRKVLHFLNKFWSYEFF